MSRINSAIPAVKGAVFHIYITVARCEDPLVCSPVQSGAEE